MSSVEAKPESPEPATAEQAQAKVKARLEAFFARLPKAPAWMTENAAQLQDVRTEIERRFEDSVTSFLASLQVAQTRDIGELAGQIRDLERRVAILERPQRGPNV